MNIQHILYRVKYPQTNGEMERWFQAYAKSRQRFEVFDEFVWRYNCRRTSSGSELGGNGTAIQGVLQEVS